MKLKISSIFLLATIIIFSGCNLSKKVSTNNLEISKIDQKVILEYLDEKTDDILSSKRGKVYSSFKLLGENKDEIYIWVVKLEYFNEGSEISHDGGDAVSIPVVLKFKLKDNNISILSHKYPNDGQNYNQSVKKLFPNNIKFPNNEEVLKLNESATKRAEEDMRKEL